MTDSKKCKFCNSELGSPFLDLGCQPLCNNNIPFKNVTISEEKYPLEVYFCSSCYLVQLAHSIAPEEIFSDYTYLSSYSESWLKHASEYSKKIIKNYNLNENSFVVEIASNDGYLLKNFVKEKIPSLGIEPANNVAKIARKSGINTVNNFFTNNLSKSIVKDFRKADLIIANNVFAHVPNITDFTKGVKNLLSENGVFTLEFPYLKNLIENNQFDTIYHEHYFYYSLLSLTNILDYHELKIFDIDELKTHGGSLRVYVTHKKSRIYQTTKKLNTFLQKEIELGLNKSEFYYNFNNKIKTIKENLITFLIKLRKEGKKIAGYGAPGKGNTLLNYCGISTDLIDFTVDRNPLKQNTFLPGSRIPVYNTEKIKDDKPDYILVLPWNLKEEIINSLNYVKDWQGKFIIPIPEVTIN